jgi:hypothetical protein
VGLPRRDVVHVPDGPAALGAPVAEVIRVVTCDRSETIAQIIERITGFRRVSGIEHGSPGVDRRLNPKSKRD